MWALYLMISKWSVDYWWQMCWTIRKMYEIHIPNKKQKPCLFFDLNEVRNLLLIVMMGKVLLWQMWTFFGVVFWSWSHTPSVVWVSGWCNHSSSMCALCPHATWQDSGHERCLNTAHPSTTPLTTAVTHSCVESLSTIVPTTCPNKKKTKITTASWIFTRSKKMTPKWQIIDEERR